jgi:hypothetical protein
MLCVTAPTLDIDILDTEAVDAAVILVQERFADRGKILLRYGHSPKVAIPFQTDTPFKKIQAELVAPDGSTDQKIEFLAMGQQVVVHGVHPVTQEMYQWSGGNPGNTKRAELPAITVEEAQALVEDIVTLTEARGYRRARKPANKNTNTNKNKSKNKNAKDNGPAGSVDAPSSIDQWGHLQANIIAGRALHDSIRDLAIRLVMSGMSGGAAVNMLRGLMELSDIRDAERWLRDIRHASGQAYTLASRDGVVGFECGGDYTASYSNGTDRPGALWHTNHPVTVGFDAAGTGADWASGSSVPRLEAVDRTVGEITSADDVKKLQETVKKLNVQQVFRHDEHACPNISYHQADLIQNKNSEPALQSAEADFVTARIWWGSFRA